MGVIGNSSSNFCRSSAANICSTAQAGMPCLLFMKCTLFAHFTMISNKEWALLFNYWRPGAIHNNKPHKDDDKKKMQVI